MIKAYKLQYYKANCNDRKSRMIYFFNWFIELTYLLTYFNVIRQEKMSARGLRNSNLLPHYLAKYEY